MGRLSGCGGNDAHYHELVLDIIRGPNIFLLYVTMKRVPKEQAFWDGYPDHNFMPIEYENYDVYPMKE